MKAFALVLGLALLSVCYAYDSDSEEHGQYRGPKGTNCTCGWTNKGNRRIVNGRETYVNEYPWMVGLGRRSASGYSLFCGASIITRNHVITAAHCTYQVDPRTLGIIAGDHDLTRTSETPHTQVYPVANKVEHRGYSPTTLQNDIAILITVSPIQFTTAVGQVCLPTRPLNLVNHKVKVTGWGTLRFRGAQATKLMKVNLHVTDLRGCSARYPRTPIDWRNPTQMCTYTPEKDACQGDSGGPVTWLDPETNRYTLVGLVSYGNGCASPGYPGVNTDVAAFMPWIQSTIRASYHTPLSTCAKVG